MTNWLERARLEMKSAGQVTANSDERNVTAVMAVPNPKETENLHTSIGTNDSTQVVVFQKIKNANEATASMTLGEETAIRAWLAHIGETDFETIAEVLDKCRTNRNERKILLQWAEELSPPIAFDDDRRRCEQCMNLTASGLCLAARRCEVNASRIYKPVRGLLHRCVGYMPKANVTINHRPINSLLA